MFARCSLGFAFLLVVTVSADLVEPRTGISFPDKRGGATLVPRVHIGARLQERLHHRRVAAVCRTHERCFATLGARVQGTGRRVHD